MKEGNHGPSVIDNDFRAFSGFYCRSTIHTPNHEQKQALPQIVI
jgi:hypothetical protein